MRAATVDESGVVRRLRAAGCVFAEDEARLLIDAAGTPSEVAALVTRRVAGEPLEQVLGWVEFCGLRIAVDPGVFVPRRRTDALVREAASLARARDVVVDLCCGSGALAVALADAVPGLELHAADIDPAAVACARRNVGAVGGRVHGGDLFQALPTGLRGRVDVLVANVPYVPSGAIASMPREARDAEPRTALDGGPDGLDVARRVAGAASTWLARGGTLLFEAAESQVPGALELLAGAGLRARLISDDDLGATVLAGTRDQARRSASPRQRWAAASAPR
jgi:release factor glutamine methyltransferase